MNFIFLSVYIAGLYSLQVLYMTQLWSKNEALLITATRGVSGHFILFNILQLLWLVFYIRLRFILALGILVLNLVNVSLLYLRLGPRNEECSFRKLGYVQIPLAKMPLAFLILEIYYHGALVAACDAHSLVCRIVANVGIWGILVIGGGVVFAFRDGLLGLALSYMVLSLAVGQLLLPGDKLQWTSGFVTFIAVGDLWTD